MPAPASAGARKRVRVNEVPPPDHGRCRRSCARSSSRPRTCCSSPGSPSLRRGVLDCTRRPAGAGGRGRDRHLRRARSRSATPCCGGSARRTAGRDELRYWDAVCREQGGRIVSWRREALAALAEPLAAANREIAPAEPGGGPDAALRHQRRAGTGGGPGAAHPAPPRGDRRQGDLERRHAGGAAPGRPRLRVRRPGPGRLRLARPAADRDPGPQARGARHCSRDRRPPAAAPAGRRVQRAGPGASVAPGAAHRRAAAGVRDHDHARRPGRRRSWRPPASGAWSRGCCAGMHPDRPDVGPVNAAAPPPDASRRGAAARRWPRSWAWTSSCAQALAMAAWQRVVAELVPRRSRRLPAARGHPAAGAARGGRRRRYRPGAAPSRRRAAARPSPPAPGGRRLSEVRVTVRTRPAPGIRRGGAA